MRQAFAGMCIVVCLAAFGGCAKDTSSPPPAMSADDAARDARRQAALAECEKQKGNESYVSCKRSANQLP